MNWLVILIFILFILTVVQGYRVGFIKMVFSILAFFLSMILVFVMTPYTTQFIKEYTPIYSFVEKQCVEVLEQSPTQEGNTIETENAALSLPKMAQAVMNGDGSQLEGALAESGVYSYLSGYLADIIIGIISFFITLAIVNIFLKIMFNSLEKVTELPGIHKLNQIAGLIAGIGKGIVSIWIFYLVLFITAGTQFGGKGIQLIQVNPILNLLYEKNLILQLILSKLG